MSQKQIHHYFKVKSKSPPEDNDMKYVQPVATLGSNEKKRSLSLRRTPIKSTNTDNDVFASAGSILNRTNSSQGSCNSSDTIIYSPVTPKKKTSPLSPSSKNKIYSPSRKRRVLKTSLAVRRNLVNELGTSATPSSNDEVLQKACEGMDDKTIFFLNIIHKYLTSDTLKPLLDTRCQCLLEKCFQLPKYSMMLVCRLYWWKRGWYTCSQLPINKEKKLVIDMPAVQQVLMSLVQNEFLVKANESENTMMTFDELTEILKLDELKKICKDLLKKKLNTKEKIIQELKAFTKVKHNMSKFLKGYKSDNNNRLLKIMRSAAGECYKLSDVIQDTLYKLYLLMYLGIDYSIIRDKNLEHMLINYKISAEISPVPKNMEVDDASVVFRCKDEFYKYVVAHEINEDVLKTKDNAERCKIVKQVYTLYQDISKEDMQRYEALPQWLHRYTPAYIYIKIIEKGVDDLKREKNDGYYHLALDVLNTCIEQTVFRQHKRASWYDMKALILQTLKRYDEAAETLILGFKSNMHLDEKDLLRKRAVKLATQKNIVVSENLKLELMSFVKENEVLEKNLTGEHIYQKPVEKSSSNNGKIEFLVKECGAITRYSAEEYCIKHYTDATGEFTHGEHREGRIISALFFLLFWDIIYCKPPDVRGIFLSHYQTYPQDLFTTSFYTNRKKLIDDLLEVIKMSTEQQLLDRIYAQLQMRDVTILGIHQDDWMSLKAVVLGLGSVAEVDDCGAKDEGGGAEVAGGGAGVAGGGAGVAGGRKLSALCARLARDYRYWRSGFPDLTLWNIKNNRIKFVEVKTDADKPSIKQIQWMHYLTAHGIENSFCYIGTNTTRCKSRAGLNNPPSNTSVPPKLDEIGNCNLESDSDFEEIQYPKTKQGSISHGKKSDVPVVDGSSDAFSDDDVILIPENYVEIVIDG